MNLDDIISSIIKSNKIAIAFHISPDGDSIGSSLALMLGLRKLNKDVYIICKDTVPDVFKFLPCISEIESAANYVVDDTDCVVVLDCGDPKRISGDINIKERDYKLINIDHHLSNEFYGDLNYVDTKSAAIGEIVYKIMKSLLILIDKDIATCIYTSILTDTGGFRHSNTTADTHTIAGDLINTSINVSEIYRIVYENKKFERIKLYGKVIDKMRLLFNGRVCIMELTTSMLDELNIENTDTSDIIGIGMEIDTVEVAVLFKETDEGIKVSLRSKTLVDVRKIAEQFRGGGHLRASGLSMNCDIEEAKEILLNVIEKELI